MPSLRPLLVALLFLFLAPLAFAQLPQAGDTTSPPTPGAGHDYVHASEETVNPVACHRKAQLSFGGMPRADKHSEST